MAQLTPFFRNIAIFVAALSQSGEISPDFCCFYGGGIRHNENIMHSFQNFIVRLIPNHPPPLETTIWKLVVRAMIRCLHFNVRSDVMIYELITYF